MFSQENTSSDVGVFCVFVSNPLIRLQYHVKVEALPGFSLLLRAKTQVTRGVVMLLYLHINVKV